MDITESLAPASEQLDAIELVAGPRIFQIDSVSRGNPEQPVNIHFVGFPRPWRPSKGMRRVLAACWGVDASQWADRFVELFYDPTVTFGKETPGGTRISRLSHIDGPQSVPLLVARGRSGKFSVEPLTDADVVAALRNEWKSANPDRKKAIEAQVAALTTPPTSEPVDAEVVEDGQ